METLLRKYLWAIDLAVIVVSSMFAARATGVMIETALGRATPAVPPLHRPPTDSGPTTRYDKDVEAILKRNIFCSTCPPIIEDPKDADTSVPATPSPVRTSMPLKLMAIMFSPPPNDPRDSVAVIRDNERNTAGPYLIGGKIRDATVVDIQETRIYLDNGGKPEFLDLLDAPPAPAAAPAAAPPPAPSSDPFAAELEKGIKKTSENGYEIQRGTVDSMLGNMAALSRAARIVPEVRDGKSVGFRLFSVKADGPFGKIGLQNGDVIYAINGMEMNSPDNALQVYTKLKAANHISVAIERNGAKLTKDYNIR